MRTRKAVGGSVMLQVPREFAECLGAQFGRRLPEFVTQDSVFDLFGIRPRAYLAMVRRESFSSMKRGRLRIARYEDVRRYVLFGDEETTKAEQASNTNSTAGALTPEEQQAVDAIARVGKRRQGDTKRKSPHSA